MEHPYVAFFYRNQTISAITGDGEIMKLQWIFTDYQHHYDTGKRVFSPVFCAQLCGYRFQMAMDWSAEKNGRLGIYLKLRHGRHQHGSTRKTLPPFKTPYALGIANQKGVDPLVYYCSPGYLMDGVGKDTPGTEKTLCKKSELSPMSIFENFVTNDSIAIYCTFKTPKMLVGAGSTYPGEAQSVSTMQTKGNVTPIPSF